jgi:hypothetical protein
MLNIRAVVCSKSKEGASFTIGAKQQKKHNCKQTAGLNGSDPPRFLLKSVL